MNKEQEEIQFLGFFGIVQESFNIISSWKKIFTQISLSLILPLSFIYLSHIILSEYLFADILHYQYMLDHTRMGTRSYDKFSDILASDLTKFFLFKLWYFIVFLVLSLLSTSAVVYTIACIYTGRGISFKKVISVVPRVWKRLIVTFLWNSVIIFVYNVGALTTMGLFAVIFLVLFGSKTTAVVFLVLLFVLYFVGFVYISLIWQLASVVSVLEDFYGLKAMRKSQDLIKGKMGISLLVFLMLGVCVVGVHLGFEWLVVSKGIAILSRICFGVIFLMLETVVMLLGFIFQTIIYFVCKSFHHENIDKSSLSDHLEVYLGEYVPLKSKDVQLEHFQV
ncbi:hypothetical protein Leryth_011327 [Lithospermum erythrorhizon]|nr:hypothetical protein Leryth_011327 [Lithospermum erythrorhizon]